MRRVARPPLSDESRRALVERTRRVLESADWKAEAERLWRRDFKAIEEVERLLRAAAPGPERQSSSRRPHQVWS